MRTIPITRSAVRLQPDPRRMIVKPYLPVGDGLVDEKTRVERVIDRVMNVPVDDVAMTLRELRITFGERHADLDDVFMQGFSAVAHSVPGAAELSYDMRRLIGAYFVHEYSLESAALTNPSIVAAPDQSGVPGGSLRIIVSVRAIGEGHVSSIEFRTGMVGPTGEVELTAADVPMIGDRRSPAFDKRLFTVKLDEMGAGDGLVRRTLDRLGERFTIADLDAALSDLAVEEASSIAVQGVIKAMHWLASSNYEITFPQDSELSQRVLFPSAPIESRGMEDARLVRFNDDDGRVVYYATYTAFDGLNILPQLIETTDFRAFEIATLNGKAAKNKGIAIFPRLVGGRYAALARCDGESNYLMQSDNVRFWHDAQQIQLPSLPWELMQVGNAGSPIETEAGWLVVTHGVGPMRRYALGAMLLDLEDPSRVIGRLQEPLLLPDETERDGYVPNVVYSCGSLMHGDKIIIAYGASDTSAGFATVEADALLAALTSAHV